MRKKILLVMLGSFIYPTTTLAHCPLCTIGAGAAAVGASYLGVKNMVSGVFIGAFAVALGLWINRLLKKQYIKYQGFFLAVFSFALTIFPLHAILRDYGSYYISLAGDYGSLLNRTYLIDKFFLGALIGAVILVLSPFVSQKITNLRKGKKIPYQGISITFIFLLIIALILQLI